MEQKANIFMRWKNFEPTKKFVFWACVCCIALTLFLGFNWGGWVTGGTARAMAEDAASEARITLATDSCFVRFTKGRNAEMRLTKLKKTEGWMRGSYLEKTGWATPIGAEDPIEGAGERCAERVLKAKGPVAATTN